jgi:hypothetical protein
MSILQTLIKEKASFHFSEKGSFSCVVPTLRPHFTYPVGAAIATNLIDFF